MELAAASLPIGFVKLIVRSNNPGDRKVLILGTQLASDFHAVLL